MSLSSLEAGWCEQAAAIWWLDPLIATAAFATFINVFGVLEEQKSPKAAAAGGATAATAQSSSESVLFWLGLRPLSLITPVAGVAYWIGVYMWVCLIPPPAASSGCDFSSSPATCARILAELIFGVLAYDAIFFAIHVLEHQGPGTLRKGAHHMVHHGPGKDVRAMHVLQHSLVDGALQVLVNIIVQRNGPFGPKLKVTRWIHNVIVTYLLTESHARIPTLPLASRFPKTFAGVLHHRRHHASGGAPYQQFFGYLDAWLFGWQAPLAAAYA
mmetsp:Transcript_48687/g.115698  ORF Transcript_48687/g.115698 Transcript_48687/m.115698 type:complete len:271 (+) Transcript_48687:123-935(+)|eukprot:CAMPEP_0178408868 /NCGR_PEP_ID=MMETSP0689_2-20121128/20165_1 /TAXON_ID=160604 /ORGANISM="Amphidinium massartii, Strain CS-259" /LENGTH=270 /DNA_ID=CAMNT_0020029985 /DNA_START=39 /DNA_END=851 /DNA_ORIENTATION=-